MSDPQEIRSQLLKALKKYHPNEYEEAYENLFKSLKRYGLKDLEPFRANDNIPGLNGLAKQLYIRGGFKQQDRMIKDKRNTLDRVVLYSYQGAMVRNVAWDPELQTPVHALINPNKLKQNYDDKVISVGFEYGFQPGDVFEWCNTNSYWIIYLQDLTELAYFRAEIRKCLYEIAWEDENGEEHKTYAAVQGPVETKINYIQKHGISVDKPNLSINMLIPLNEDTKAYFKRYSKFYLQGDDVCWRVEAIDWISMPNILQINAVEYYANESEDDIESGLVGVLKTKTIDPNPPGRNDIEGDTFIKVREKATYIYKGDETGKWYLKEKVPIKYQTSITPEGYSSITVFWDSSYHGQFTLCYGRGLEEDSQKTVVVESLF